MNPLEQFFNEALLAGEYVMVSNRAGAACLVDENNGIVIDIDKEFIDFETVNKVVRPIGENWQVNESKMPYTFRVKMDDLLWWIEEL